MTTTTLQKPSIDRRQIETSSPRYEQARRVVVKHIRDFDLKAGDRIPTEMELRRCYGWSRDTINRALNDLVASGMLKRVQGSGTFVADPNPIVETAKTMRIVVGSRQFQAHDDYCNAVFAGIREEAAEQQVEVRYYMDEVVPGPNVVREFKADGVLSMSWEVDDWPQVYRLSQSGVPIVGFALRSRIAPAPVVCTDNYGGVEKAMQTLLDRGHKRIAFISVNMQCDDSQERSHAYHHMMAKAGLAMPPSYAHFSRVHWEPALLEAWWLSLNPAPTALILDGVIASMMLSVFNRIGVRIPEDVSIVVTDDMSAVRHFDSQLSFIRQPTYQLGRAGLKKLLRMLRGEDSGMPEVLPTEFVEGTSIRTIDSDSE